MHLASPLRVDGLDGIVPMRLRDVDPSINRTTGSVIDASLEVQRALGVGLLERAYEAALAHELGLRGHTVERQVLIHGYDKDLVLPNVYRADLMVDGLVLVELKACEALDPRHFAQVVTYLRFSGRRVGLLINFHALPLKTGIHRIAL